MDVDALIEEQTLLYKKVKASAEQHLGKLPPTTQVDVIYTSVHNWQMNHAIKSQQDERAAKGQQQIDEPPSEKQMKYAEDLGIIIPKGCTKKELSKLINAKA